MEAELLSGVSEDIVEWGRLYLSLFVLVCISWVTCCRMYVGGEWDVTSLSYVRCIYLLQLYR